MKISYNWLKEFISFPYSPKDLADKLISLGLEVEEVKKIDLPKVIIGEIINMEPHPDADKLRICDVFTGEERLKIVCGAKNVKKGGKYPLALAGAVLPGGIKVEKRKIRGVESAGMFCSEKELDVGEDSSGIWELPSNVKVGEEVFSSLSLRDWVLNISITPNRGDCLSILGIAREIGAITGKKLNLPETGFSSIEEKFPFKVEIKESELSPRYTLRMIKDVKVGESPLEIRWRLRLSGIRSVNNVVDITNYVMLELGQPLHAFDMNKIQGGEIIVRKANNGEKLKTLDGEERILSSSDLVIADKNNPIALAGVMGGKESEISDETENILLESACFKPQCIRRTSRRFGLVSESSYRFERGVDWNNSLFASNRASFLIEKYSGGKIIKESIDIKKKGLKEKKILFNPEKIENILGKNVSDYEEIFAHLGFEYKKKDGNLEVKVPSFRYDIGQEIDLIEEIARIHGYEDFPSTLPEGKTPRFHRDKEWENIEKVRNLVVRMGINEITTYSFIPSEFIRKINFPVLEEAVEVRNPLSEEWQIMRFSLLPGIIQVGSLNLSRGNCDMKIFEVGKVYLRKNGNFTENYHIGGLLSGIWQKGGWVGNNIPVSIFHAKGIVEKILEKSGKEYSWEKGSSSLMESALTIKISGRDVGIVGELKEEIREKLGIDMGFYLWEIYLENLHGEIFQNKLYKELTKFPPLKRDLSVLVKENVPQKVVENLIRGASGSFLKDMYLFDFYRGKQIPDGYKSFAYSLIFQKESGTLTDEEGKEIMEKIEKHLEEKNIKVRKE